MPRSWNVKTRSSRYVIFQNCWPDSRSFLISQRSFCWKVLQFLQVDSSLMTSITPASIIWPIGEETGTSTKFSLVNNLEYFNTFFLFVLFCKKNGVGERTLKMVRLLRENLWFLLWFYNNNGFWGNKNVTYGIGKFKAVRKSELVLVFCVMPSLFIDSYLGPPIWRTHCLINCLNLLTLCSTCTKQWGLYICTLL